MNENDQESEPLLPEPVALCVSWADNSPGNKTAAVAINPRSGLFLIRDVSMDFLHVRARILAVFGLWTPELDLDPVLGQHGVGSPAGAATNMMTTLFHHLHLNAFRRSTR